MVTAIYLSHLGTKTGGSQVENGEGGEWKMENGKWKMKVHKFTPSNLEL